MSSETLYEVRFQQWNRSWLLSGPVGANGKLLFSSASEATSFARWNAKANGGTIKIHDEQGSLFKTIDIEGEISGEDGFVLPSV